jgi:hypothetical protein
MSYRSKLACAVTLCLIGLAGIAPAERAVANDPDLPGKGEQPTTVQMATLQGAAIISDGPLTNVFASPDLNCAVNHADDQFGEFYADTACATLVATGGTLYGPAQILAGGNASPRAAFTAIDQQGPLGSGTLADPYRIVTRVDLGSSGLTLTQVDSYVVARESYRTDVGITNNAGTPRSGVLYRAGDCYLQDSDWGLGRYTPATGAVACLAAEQDQQGNWIPASRILEWTPLTPNSNYFEGWYYELWSRIGSQQPLPDTSRANEFIDNGAGLSWNFALGAGATATYSHTTTFSPSQVSRQECASQELEDAVPPAPGGGRVTVHYDSRFVVDESIDPDGRFARQVAEALRDRADLALEAFEELGFDTPQALSLDIVCSLALVLQELTPPGALAVVVDQGRVQIRSDYVAQQFAPVVLHQLAAGGPEAPRPDGWNSPPASWVNTVDHEIFHTVQYRMRDLLGLPVGLPAFWMHYYLLDNDTVFESTAVLAQDLIADADDEGLVADSGQYLDWISRYMTDRSPIDLAPPPDNYRAAAVLQYWGERFGPAGAQTFEHRVAEFMRRLLDPLWVRTGAMIHAIAGQADVYDALRDFYVGAYSLDAPNVSHTNNSRFQILDAVIPHGADEPGQDPNVPPDYTPLRVEPLGIGTAQGGRLQSTEAIATETSVSAGVTRLRVSVTPTATTIPCARILNLELLSCPAYGDLRVAIVPKRADGHVVLRDAWMTQTEGNGQTFTRVVDVAPGWSVATILVGSHQPAEYEIRIDDVTDAEVSINGLERCGQQISIDGFFGHAGILAAGLTTADIGAQITRAGTPSTSPSTA